MKAIRLLDQMRERLRYMHYSLRTEQTYLFWVRWFIRFSGLRHPKESALLYLYKEVLCQQLPWLQEIGRPSRSTETGPEDPSTGMTSMIALRQRRQPHRLNGIGGRAFDRPTPRA